MYPLRVLVALRVYMSSVKGELLIRNSRIAARQREHVQWAADEYMDFADLLPRAAGPDGGHG